MDIKRVECCSVCEEFEDNGKTLGSCSKGKCNKRKCEVIGSNLCADFKYSFISESLYVNYIISNKD